jgi:hypothetical protein
MEKKCTKCGEVKSLDEFNKRKYSKDGKQQRCKICQKEYRDSNKSILELTKIFYQNKGLRICNKCEIVKSLSDFGNETKTKDGKRRICKCCTNEKRKIYEKNNKEKRALRWKIYSKINKDKIKKYREDNKEKRKEYNKEYQVKNKYKLKEYNKKYRKENLEELKEKQKKYRNKNIDLCKKRSKDYREKNREKISIMKKKYIEKNREKISKKRYENIEEVLKKEKKYREVNKDKNNLKRRENHKKNRSKNNEYKRKNRYKYREQNNKYAKYYRKFKSENDPLYKLTINIRSNISRKIKNQGYTKKTKTYNILQCEFSFFMQWLNGIASNGYTYGVGDLHLDHVVPVSLAETEEEILLLCHYSNYQLLSADKNLAKSNRYVNPTNLKRVLEHHPNPDKIREIHARF